MHFLYLDESGNHTQARWFVLAGISVPERQTHWIEQALDDIAKRFGAEHAHAVELHGNPMLKGNGRWRKVEREIREQAIEDALVAGIQSRMRYGIRLFAVVIDREKLAPEQAPMDLAFEQISSRFDYMLTRLNSRSGRAHERGLILLDKAANELTIQKAARRFKTLGHSWGKTRNYAEVPVFLDSEHSRLIQLADLAAYAIYQAYAQQNRRYYDVIRHCFDSDDGKVHGLFEN